MMRLDENLFEALTEETSDGNKVGGKEIAKQQAIKEMANIDFEVGHTFDPDDFNYFKKVCKEDGWNVTEEDFQKYFEYLGEIRANRFADEDGDNSVDLGDWEEMESKQVEDSDGFMTDYTWYVKDNEDGSETHVMIFGDQDLYTPMNSEPDAEFDGEDVAREWFDNYKGFAEDLDEDYHRDSFGQSNWYENVDDVMHDYEKGWLTKARAMEICDEEGWEFYDDLDESINNADKDYAIEYYDNVPAAERRPATIDDVENYYKEEVVAFPDDFSACVYALAIHDQENYEFNQQEYLEEFGYADELKTTADVITKLDDIDWGDGSIIICKITQDGRVVYDSGLSKESLLKDVDDDNLEEAIKPNIESEELKALAQKHNIKILDAMSNGDLRMEGAGADLMKFYQEAEKLGLWEVSPELYEAKISISKDEMDILDKEVEDAAKEVAQYKIKLKKLSDGSVEPDFSETPEDKIDQAKAALDRYNKAIEARPDRAKDIITYTEALHGKEELDEFTQLSNKLGFTTVDQMQHIMNAAKSLGKSELEMLKSIDKTFDGKIPDKMIDGITDTFLTVAEEVGLESNEDYQRFVKEEVEPGETITQAILRYRDELNQIDPEDLNESLNEIAVINVNKKEIFDAIANAKAYIDENKYSQAHDSLTYAAKLLNTPIQESAMSNLAYEISEAGGEQNWKDLANKSLDEMEDSLHYLKTYAPKEIGAGGNYDSASELQDDIDYLETAIRDLRTKLDYINSIKRKN